MTEEGEPFTFYTGTLEFEVQDSCRPTSISLSIDEDEQESTHGDDPLTWGIEALEIEGVDEAYEDRCSLLVAETFIGIQLLSIEAYSGASVDIDDTIQGGPEGVEIDDVN